MTENLPSYVSIVFILTTFLTVGFILRAIRDTVYNTFAAKTLVFLISFWLFFQSIFALYGFYKLTPRNLPFVGVLPSVLLVVALFIFARKSFIEPLPLKTLTLLSIVRIPVELCIFWLFQNKLMPQIMTFEGWNFDILSGISAIFITWFAFRGGKINPPILILWNVFGLILLINIVIIAVLSAPLPIQKFAFEQPNVAVLYFPFIWLPTI
ncbi:MAG TPA: hypothetical protein PKE69_09975, partial [Pyrinomonadaceae bacterium]|nr:hypothetical protein [Pyrinomonadaceae bacterium]